MSEDLFDTATENTCPQCGHYRLRTFNELKDDEQELVKRLPASKNFSLGERKSKHRWCRRCWNEATNTESFSA